MNQFIPHRILIADDSDTDRLLLQTILRREGHQVLIAKDGVEAIEVYRRELPEMVFLDVMMPNMDGFEAAEAIKKLIGEDFVPIIFLTALHDAASLARGLEVGGDDFLSKPYNAIVLRAKINAYSRMAAMHRMLQQQRDEIIEHNNRLLYEQETAKRVFDKVAHGGCLNASNIQYSLSPLAIFNGDVALSGMKPSGNLAVLLGDFTGHGLNAAIGAMPMAQIFYSMIEKGFSIADIVREINFKLHAILPTGVFCCLAIAELNFSNGLVQVWNGGLPDGVIFSPLTRGLRFMKSRHLPVGILPDTAFDAGTETFQTEVGDRLFFWSDGIHEAQNANEELFGEQRLLEVFNDSGVAPQDLFSTINRRVSDFIGAGSAEDDLSVIEIAMVDAAAFTTCWQPVTTSNEFVPGDWQLNFCLLPDSLRLFDPLPLMLHVLMQMPFLRAHSGKIYTVMAELFSNALEHGVLRLNSNLKDSPQGFARYYQMRSQRLALLDSGYVRLALAYRGDRSQGRLMLEVEDSGEGFDHQARVALEGGNNYSGRGIKLLNSLCDEVCYTGSGNAVRVYFNVDRG